ncbi:MAG: tetratricopeptide repeat protein [Bacteroidota bacterium]
MKIKYFLSVILFFSLLIGKGCGGDSFAQNKNIDSLLNLLTIDKPDTSKVNHLNKLSREYKNIGEYDSSLKYGNKALALASSLRIGNKIGWAKGIAQSYTNIGIIYRNNGNYNEALKKHFAALKINENIGDKKAIALSYSNIGFIYWNQGHISEALKNSSTSLKMYKDIGDKRGISSSLINLGLIYYFQGNYPEALRNYLLSLKIAEELGDKKAIAISYSNIGLIYQSQGKYREALKSYFASLKIFEEINDKSGIAKIYHNIGNVYYFQGNRSEALKNYLVSLKIRQEINDKQGIAGSYTNIGSIYWDQGNYPETLKNYLASLKISESIGDKNSITTSFINLGEVQIKLRKYKTAKEYLNKALQLGKELGDKESIKYTYGFLSKLDSVQGNWKDAYQYNKLFIIYRDSLDNEKTKKKIIESTMNDEFDRKEAAGKAIQDKKDVLAEAKKKQASSILILVSLALGLVFLFAGFIFRSLRITGKQKKLIEIQKNEVSHQKEIADSQRIIAEDLREISEDQKHIVEEKQREIVASITYAKRIQTALLTSDEYIKNHLPSEHFILFKPKDIVSGDFYWALSLAPSADWDMGTNEVELSPAIARRNIFYMVTADCTGHGVPGAFMSMLNISYLHENIVERNILLPHDILNSQRKKIIQALNPIGNTEECKDGMDCTLCVYDFDKMLLHFAAANNPLWLVRNGELIEFKADKMPVGKYNEKMDPFTLQTIELQKGDVIYTSTDGFADQFGGNGKKLMKKKFKEELLKIQDQPMKEQHGYLNDFFEHWKGSSEQVDDVCVIGIRI